MKKIIFFSALVLLVPFWIECVTHNKPADIDYKGTCFSLEIDNRENFLVDSLAERRVPSRKPFFSLTLKPAAVFSDGFLPWPHQWPGISQDEYDSLIKNLWIINNYGQYQAAEDISIVYFHDGLDIVLDNGTKLYAVQSGYVKAVSSAHIIIGDTEGGQPGNGWLYAHVNNLQVKEGDHVFQGDYIADVFFQGLAHVHLTRLYVESGSWKDYENLNCVHPNKYFFYEDTQPPVIKKPFYYFKNNTDTLFENTSPAVVWGDVDIVVGIREQGEYAHSKETGFGDRLCMARIEYEITGENVQPLYEKSFDFTKIIINNMEEYRRYRVFTVYKHYKIFHPVIDPFFWDKTFSYYIITNTDGTGEFEKIDVSAADYAWNTAEADESGNPRFPDGLYYITVTAYDFMGNYSQTTDTVRVRNTDKRVKPKR